LRSDSPPALPSFPTRRSSDLIAPSRASRPARFAAFAAPFARRRSTAFSMSPPVSSSAFLHSIIPAPVRSRSSFTCSAVIAISLLSSPVQDQGAASPPGHLFRLDRRALHAPIREKAPQGCRAAALQRSRALCRPPIVLTDGLRFLALGVALVGRPQGRDRLRARTTPATRTATRTAFLLFRSHPRLRRVRNR